MFLSKSTALDLSSLESVTLDRGLPSSQRASFFN
jgi:hypothetical protein